MSKKFGEKTTALEVIEGHNLSGKEVIVTGGSSGIGVETVRALAKAGARVVIAARDLKRANEVKDDVIQTTGNNNVEVEELELGSLKSVDKFIERYLAKKRPLHILINNAGVMNTPQGVTEDGFETQFGINHIGHFALTVGLLPALKEAKNARVVVVSSLAHRMSDVVFEDINYKNRQYDGSQSYGKYRISIFFTLLTFQSFLGQSKTANMLFAIELTRRYKDDGIFSNSLMPGVILTGLQRYTNKEVLEKRGIVAGNPFFKTIEQGASTTVWAALAPELEGKGGLYLENCEISHLVTAEEMAKATSKGWSEGVPTGYLAFGADEENAKKLWTVTEEMIENARKSNKN